MQCFINTANELKYFLQAFNKYFINNIFYTQAFLLRFPLAVWLRMKAKTDDMVDILETIQQKYVPYSQSTDETPADLLFFGGDQLTEERARNIQRARADGETGKERLDTIWPKNEDWHAIRTAYKVCYAIVSHGNYLNTIAFGKLSNNTFTMSHQNDSSYDPRKSKPEKITLFTKASVIIILYAYYMHFVISL